MTWGSDVRLVYQKHTFLGRGERIDTSTPLKQLSQPENETNSSALKFSEFEGTLRQHPAEWLIGHTDPNEIASSVAEWICIVCGRAVLDFRDDSQMMPWEFMAWSDFLSSK